MHNIEQTFGGRKGKGEFSWQREVATATTAKLRVVRVPRAILIASVGISVSVSRKQDHWQQCIRVRTHEPAPLLIHGLK